MVRQAAFTLVELLIALGIIIALLGLTFPAVAAIRRSQARSGTEALVALLARAMADYGVGNGGIHVPGTAGSPAQVRLLWDFNGDGIVDGDPARDPAFDAAAAAAAARAGYTGPAAMLGTTLSSRQIDQHGRIVDGWRRPLHISRFPSGSGSPRPWSLGADGLDGTDDDIVGWRSGHRP